MGRSRQPQHREETTSTLIELLPTVIQAVYAAPQVHQATERACVAIGKALHAQAAFVLWYSESERAFVGMPSGYGVEDALLCHIHLPAGMCAATDHAFLHNAPYVSDQTDEEELLTSQLRRRLQLTRLLSLPIRDDRQARGVLHVVNKQGKPFDQKEVAFASSVAQTYGAALALLHYRHYIDRMAVTDHLTGLFNRYHLEALLEEHTRRAQHESQPLSVAVVFLDHLKHINDTYGYRSGDRALLAVAQALQRALGQKGILSRYAGDQFVALMPGMNLREAQARMQVVRDLIAQECWEPLGCLSVSIGVVNYPESAIPADHLLSAAEDAALAAKRHGRNQVVMVAPRCAA